MRGNLGWCWLPLLSLVLGASSVPTAPGSLDPTFGDAGRVLTSFESRGVARAIAIQDDGKIVIVGRIGTYRTGPAGGTRDIAVTRYLPDGSLDLTFGTGGVARTDVTGGIDAASQVVVQPDGMIVAGGVGGRTVASEPVSDFALVRYQSDGSPDGGFGSAGRVTTDFGFRDGVQALTLQPDGKIIAAGYSFDDVGDGPIHIAIARYEPDGALDGTFGTGGMVATIDGQAMAVSVQSDGAILVAGASCCDTQTGEWVFKLLRYLPDGSPDPSFGDDGVVATPARLDPSGMTFAPDGSVFATGFQRFNNAHCSSNAFAVGHFRADGTLDVEFGHDGVARTIVSCSSYALGVTTQTEGRIMAVGVAYPHNRAMFAVVRYRQDGSRDLTFGSNGKVTTSFGPAPAVAQSVAVDEQGRAVVVGGAGPAFAVARYLG